LDFYFCVLLGGPKLTLNHFFFYVLPLSRIIAGPSAELAIDLLHVTWRDPAADAAVDLSAYALPSGLGCVATCALFFESV
jgi:hypothetical protein